MTSTIPEAAASQRSKSFNLLIFILVTSMAIALSGDRVFASFQSVGIPDRDVLDNSYFSGTIYPTQAAYHVEGATNELVIPVFYNMSNFPDTYNMAYLSGYVMFQNIGLNVFGSDTSAPVNVMPEWFEPANTDTIQIAWSTSYSLRIYFNNYRILDNSSNNRIILLGYIHYTFDEASSAFWYQFPTANKQVNAASNGIMYGSAYEYGFADSIIYAIDTSTDINQIITWLADISQNTAYAYQILSGIQSRLVIVDGHVVDLYDLIYDYLYPDQNPGAEDASEAAAQVGSQAAQEHAAQESLYALSPGNMNDLDRALNDFGLLDSVKNSTDFWGFCISEFSSRSGPIWGIFIFGLILGLIAFILRLSK